MEHRIYDSTTFNYLTYTTDNGIIQITGETREEISKGDVILGFPLPNDMDMIVSDVLERRDSKDFPEGITISIAVFVMPSRKLY